MDNKKITSPLFKNNEEKLNSLLQSMPDLLFLFKPDGTIIAYHAAHSDSLFIPPDKIIGSNIKDIPIKQENIDEIFLAVKKTLETGELECIYYSSFIGEKEIHFEARIIANNENEIFTIIKEVTDIVEIEKSFYKYLESYQKSTHTIAEALILTNEKGKISFWNNTATKIFRIVKDNAIGENIKDLIDIDEFAQKFDSYQKHLADSKSENDSSISFEIRIDNDLKPLLFKFTQIKIGTKQQLLITANFVEKK